MDCHLAESYVLGRLRQQLPASLSYHSLSHTLDVAAQAQALAAAEGVTDAEQLALLRVAALYHDAGFLTTYQGHEAAGCALARQVLPGFGFAPAQLDLICRLIMATRLPQSPGTELLARILCDADLDYLGRPDFWPISNRLRDELLACGLVEGEVAWQRLQLGFLRQHHYWTASALVRREAGKQARLAEVETLLSRLLAE